MMYRVLITLCAAAALAGCGSGKPDDERSDPAPILWELA